MASENLFFGFLPMDAIVEHEHVRSWCFAIFEGLRNQWVIFLLMSQLSAVLQKQASFSRVLLANNAKTRVTVFVKQFGKCQLHLHIQFVLCLPIVLVTGGRKTKSLVFVGEDYQLVDNVFVQALEIQRFFFCKAFGKRRP